MNDVLHICADCLKEHNLHVEEEYQSIRPCDACAYFNRDNSSKTTSFVRETLKMLSQNKARREFGYNELRSILPAKK